MMGQLDNRSKVDISCPHWTCGLRICRSWVLVPPGVHCLYVLLLGPVPNWCELTLILRFPPLATRRFIFPHWNGVTRDFFMTRPMDGVVGECGTGRSLVPPHCMGQPLRMNPVEPFDR